MRLADKRKAIEVLLCAARSTHDSMYLDVTASRLGYVGRHHAEVIDLAWDELQPVWIWDELHPEMLSHGAACLEAAYRLIESSPTLRREWFGVK